MEGLRKVTKNFGQDSRSPDRDLCPGLPEYEAEVLTTQTRHSARGSRSLFSGWCDVMRFILSYRHHILLR
jgi:hypothetical protein